MPGWCRPTLRDRGSSRPPTHESAKPEALAVTPRDLVRRTVAVLALVSVLGGGFATNAAARPGAWSDHASLRAARQLFTCRLRAARLGDEITVTFWLNSTIARRGWRIRIRQNDETILSTIRRTNAEGNLRVETVTANRAGPDAFLGKARDLVTGGLCRVALEV
jgi:hypothetical protein